MWAALGQQARQLWGQWAGERGPWRLAAPSLPSPAALVPLVGPARWPGWRGPCGLGAGQDHAAAKEPDVELLVARARNPTALERTWRRNMSLPRFCRSKISASLDIRWEKLQGRAGSRTRPHGEGRPGRAWPVLSPSVRQSWRSCPTQDLSPQGQAVPGKGGGLIHSRAPGHSRTKGLSGPGGQGWAGGSLGPVSSGFVS